MYYCLDVNLAKSASLLKQHFHQSKSVKNNSPLLFQMSCHFLYNKAITTESMLSQQCLPQGALLKNSFTTDLACGLPGGLRDLSSWDVSRCVRYDRRAQEHEAHFII